MATRTRHQLVSRALEVLHLDGGTGQEANAEDYAKMDARVDPALAMLEKNHAIPTVDPDAVELLIFEPLARYLAEVGSDIASRPADAAAMEYYTAQLMRLTADEPTYEVHRGMYF